MDLWVHICWVPASLLSHITYYVKLSTADPDYLTYSLGDLRCLQKTRLKNMKGFLISDVSNS